MYTVFHFKCFSGKSWSFFSLYS